MRWFKRRKPGPTRQVANRIGTLQCDLCGMEVPLLGHVVSFGGMLHIMSEGAEEELHMLVEHGIVVD